MGLSPALPLCTVLIAVGLARAGTARPSAVAATYRPMPSRRLRPGIHWGVRRAWVPIVTSTMTVTISLLLVACGGISPPSASAAPVPSSGALTAVVSGTAQDQASRTNALARAPSVLGAPPEFAYYSVSTRADQSGGPLVLDREVSATRATPTPTNRAYSVAYETELNPSVLGRSRDVHFNRANGALDDAIRADPDFAARMDQMIPGVGDDVARAGGRTTPQDWTWHHAPSSQVGRRQGVMQLVPTAQHQPGSIWQHLFHPNGAGGYSEWAIPNGAPRN